MQERLTAETSSLMRERAAKSQVEVPLNKERASVLLDTSERVKNRNPHSSSSKVMLEGRQVNAPNGLFSQGSKANPLLRSDKEG
jgi:hypothetical protein